MKRYDATRHQLGRMIREGGSWSGRERNKAFLNIGGAKFADVSAVASLDFLDDGRAYASVDWDRDGDLDLFESSRIAPGIRYLRNDWRAKPHFLRLLLVGTKSNRDAIGARVEVKLPSGPLLVRTVSAGSGFLSQSSKWIHFGLGDGVSQMLEATIRWPSGATEKISGLAADKRYRVVEGAGRAEEWKGPGPAPVLDPVPAKAPKETDASRSLLSARVKLPLLEYEDMGGKRHRLEGLDRPVVVNLWATWCAPCSEELGEFTRRAKEIRAAGLDLVALSVDGLGDDGSSPDKARAMLKQIGLPFRAGLANPKLLDKLEVLRGQILSLRTPFPIPTSLLVTRGGELAAVYQGRVSVDDLLKDAATLELSPRALRAQALPFPGRLVVDPLIPDLTEIAATFDEEGHHEDADRYRKIDGRHRALDKCVEAERERERGRLDKTAERYREALALDPKCVQALNGLGGLLLDSGKANEALPLLKKAAAVDPLYAHPPYNLAVAAARRNDLDKAEPLLRDAIRDDPEFRDAHLLLGRVLLARGKLDPAIAALERALSLGPDQPDALVELGRARVEKREGGPAERELRHALERAPNDARARFELGRAFALQNRLDEATASFRRAAELAPKSAEPEAALAQVEAYRGNHAEAKRHLERALQIDPQNKAARELQERLRAAP